ncbi:MAG: GreA/GreB family elongation factor [Actinomycetes bacterium]
MLVPLGAMLGDPSHDRRIDVEYERAFAEATRLEQLLAEAQTVRSPEQADVVALGSLVDVQFPDGSLERLRLVHPEEAFLDDERISVDSPVSRAMIGHRVGDEVVVVAPVGRLLCRIVAVSQPEE